VVQTVDLTLTRFFITAHLPVEANHQTRQIQEDTIFGRKTEKILESLLIYLSSRNTKHIYDPEELLVSVGGRLLLTPIIKEGQTA